MKELNNIIFTTGGELQSYGSTPTVKGRIRFNSSTNIWEYSNDAGVTWMPFSSSLVTSVNGQVGDVSIGGFAALTCYVVGAGGNDSSGEIGNILRPFATIGGAIEIARITPGSIIEVLPGTYNLNDANTPFGLMYPNANYDYYFHPNSIVNYTGTYGFYISDANTRGNIYGYGAFIINSSGFSGSVDSVNGYAVNIGINGVRKQIQGISLLNNSNSSTSGLMRCGNCTGTGFTSSIVAITARGGHTIFVDNGARFTLTANDIQNTSPNPTTRTVVINNPITSEIKDVNNLLNYGHAFGGNMSVCVEVINVTSTSTIIFRNVKFYTVLDSNTTSTIKFTTSALTITDILFERCFILNRNNNTNPITGNSISSDNDIGIKLLNNYSNAPISSTGGVITNIVSGGVIGLLYNTNL